MTRHTAALAGDFFDINIQVTDQSFILSFSIKGLNENTKFHFSFSFINSNLTTKMEGKLVQKDFSIQEEAGGVGKAIIKNFTAIVTGNALEIRFYWAGKGTTGVPVRGVYGPLISAISVTPGKLRKFYELNHQDSVRTVQNHQCSLVLSNLCTLSIQMTNKSGGHRTNLPFLFIIGIWEVH